VGRRIETAVRICSELVDMSPEGESIKPDDEDVETEDLGFDKTEGDETPPEEKWQPGGVAVKKPLPDFIAPM
jgi:hypothetical protein